MNFFPFVIVTVLIFSLLGLQDMKFITFLPIMADSSILNLNIGVIDSSSRLCVIIAFSMIVPNSNKDVKLNKTFYIIAAISTIVIIFTTMSTQAVLGIEQAKQSNFPYFIFSQQVKVFDFIEHIGFISVINWFIGTFIRISLFLYLASIGLMQIVKIKSNKLFIILISLIVFILPIFTPLSK